MKVAAVVAAVAFFGFAEFVVVSSLGVIVAAVVEEIMG